MPGTLPVISSWALTWALAAAPVDADLGAPPPAASDFASLALHGGPEGGQLEVLDHNAQIVASAAVGPGEVQTLQLPPGSYRVRQARGDTIAEVTLAAHAPPVEVRMPTAPPSGPAAPVARAQPAAIATNDPVPEGPVAAEIEAPAEHRAKPKKWKRVVSPLMSALIPGTGQMVNGQVGKGFGMLLGTLALAGGAIAVNRSLDPLEGAAHGTNADTFNNSAITAAGFGVLTGGLQMLYASQIMDAYAVAAGIDHPTPKTDHKLSLQVARMATVGYRVGDPAAALYRDWNVSLMFQVVRRLSIGLSDVGMSMSGSRTTIQAGARVHYRFLDKGRLWMGAALGAMVQGTWAKGQPQSIAFGADAPETEAAATVVPYGQLDLKLFIVNRWSVNLWPRFSVPFGTRRFLDDHSLPTHAATFELGTGVGVYF
ncbi:MAG: hypothetical protein KC636_21520 [Myxococcales bacterium]|nr:hypothetical protein [Myxococcales bacterium]